MLRVTVCGDGPIAHSIAAVCASRGHSVCVLVSDPRIWRQRLAVSTWHDSRFVVPLGRVTDDPRVAMTGAELILLCVPHAAMDTTLRKIARDVSSDALVGAIPGFGAFGPLARRRLPHVVCTFGTQRIPFVVRRHQVGRSVELGGARRQTFVGTMPHWRARPVAELLAQVLGVNTVPTSHYFNVELSPSNSIVNPARLYALFGAKNAALPAGSTEFFSDWDLASSHLLLALSNELQRGRSRIPRDTSFVAPILLQYDANDAATLTDRFRGLVALKGRRVPVRGRTVDVHSHYFSEDIDNGLRLIRDILHLAGEHTPMMDKILAWRASLLPRKEQQRRATAAGPLVSFQSIEALGRALD